jgi:chromosome segregation ATPase
MLRELQAATQKLEGLEASHQATCSELAAVKEELARSVQSNNAALREVEEACEERDAGRQRLAELEAAHQATCNRLEAAEDRLEAAEGELAACMEALRVSEAALKNELADLMLAVERAGILAPTG